MGAVTIRRAGAEENETAAVSAEYGSLQGFAGGADGEPPFIHRFFGPQAGVKRDLVRQFGYFFRAY
jgi:hypothetical protein